VHNAAADTYSYHMQGAGLRKVVDGITDTALNGLSVVYCASATISVLFT
jgi:hypothetical protein